jgi:dihydrofolate reductase
MGRVVAAITTSVDGYVAGPDDGPGRGLGEGGEALHSWVFGGPWTYEDQSRLGEMDPDDRAWWEQEVGRTGAFVAGRWMYEAAGRWGGHNPWGRPCFVVTHRPHEQPDGDDFVFVDGVGPALARARDAAGDEDVAIAGGGDVIRQALAAGLVDRLTIILAPLVLGGGKRLFDGFEQRVELRQLGVRQSRWATFVDYEVLR